MKMKKMRLLITGLLAVSMIATGRQRLENG